MDYRSFSRLFWVSVLGIFSAMTTWFFAPSYSGGNFLGVPMFDGLIDRVNDVAVMSIEHKGVIKTFLKDDQGDWTLVEAGNYPADKTRIRNALIGLAGLEKVEPKTSLPEFYKDIRVEDNTDENGQSYLVTLLDNQGQQISSLLVGKLADSARLDARGYFVRFPNDPQSWLVRGNLDVTGSPKSWMITRFLPVNEEDIERITIFHGKREVVFSRETKELLLTSTFKSDSFVQTSPAFIQGVVNVLTAFEFEEVFKKPDSIKSETPIFSITIATFSGVEYYIALYSVDGVMLASLGCMAKETASPELQKATEKLQVQYNEWLYQLPVEKVAPLLPFTPIPQTTRRSRIPAGPVQKRTTRRIR